MTSRERMIDGSMKRVARCRRCRPVCVKSTDATLFLHSAGVIFRRFFELLGRDSLSLSKILWRRCQFSFSFLVLFIFSWPSSSSTLTSSASSSVTLIIYPSHSLSLSPFLGCFDLRFSVCSIAILGVFRHGCPDDVVVTSFPPPPPQFSLYLSFFLSFSFFQVVLQTVFYLPFMGFLH